MSHMGDGINYVQSHKTLWNLNSIILLGYQVREFLNWDKAKGSPFRKIYTLGNKPVIR